MRQFFRFLAAGLSILLIAAMFAGCGGGSSSAAASSGAESSGEASGGEASSGADAAAPLRVGMECAYAPFNWTQVDDSNGAAPIEGGGYAGGYDVEIAKKIAAGLGRELLIVKTEWDGLEPSVNAGKIDAIIAGMSIDETRLQSMDFSENYYTSAITVVVRKDGPYANAKTLSDFAGARITGQLNTLHYDFIDQMEGVTKETAMEDFPTMVIAVTSGKVDGYTTEVPGAQSAVATNPELTYIEFAEGEGFIPEDINEVSVAVALKKGSDLVAPINEILATIPEEERQQLMADAVKNQPSAG
jgi:ABC-type amino acid transport substrate-binding protein